MNDERDENLTRLASRDSARLDAGVIRLLTARVLAAAHDVFGEHLRTVVLKGSTVNGSFIPYFSDFDVHLFVDSAALRNATTLTPERALAFQERIGAIDPEAFGLGYLQVRTVPWDNDPDALTPPVSGTYTIVEGAVPPGYRESEHQPAHLDATARAFLDGLDGLIDKHVNSVVDRADPLLAREVRYLATSLKPAVYQAAVVLGVPRHDPIATWRAPFSILVQAVEDVAISNRGISSFYSAVIGGHPAADGWLMLRRDPSRLRGLFAVGIESLLALRAWYAHQ